jgi:cytochrome P450
MPVPIAYDPPEHTRFRQKLHSYFTPQKLNQLLPALQEQASALIDAVGVTGACDGISDIAIPFPFGALATLCGLAFEDRDKLAAWADVVNWDAPWSPPAFELLNYLVEAIGSDERPALVAELLSGEDGFTEDEVIGSIRFFASPRMACRQPSGQRSFSWSKTPSFVRCCAKTRIR